MSVKDKQLISEAKHLHPSDWGYLVNHIIPQAESREAETELRRIANYLYHLDEYGVGAL
jgi:hypothetical protein